MNLTYEQKQKYANKIKTEIRRRAGIEWEDIKISISSANDLTIEILGSDSEAVMATLTPFWTLEKVIYKFTNLIDPTWDFIR